jgi:hypothetical protein
LHRPRQQENRPRGHHDHHHDRLPIAQRMSRENDADEERHRAPEAGERPIENRLLP